MEYKPILFIDFDGTLCHDRLWKSLPNRKYQEVQRFLFGEDGMLVREWMRGNHSAEDINRLVASKIEVSFEDLWNLFVEDCKTMQVSISVLEKINLLRNRFVTILITGNMDSFSRFTVPALGLDRYFDYVSNSYYEQKFKTDSGGALFIKYLEKFDALVQQSVIIDDSPNVCQIFGNLGGKVCLVSPEKSLEEYLDTIIAS